MVVTQTLILATFPMAYQKVCTNCNVNRKVAITACTIQCNTTVRRLPRIPRLFPLFSQKAFPFEAMIVKQIYKTNLIMRYYFVIFFLFILILTYFSTSNIFVILYFYSFRKIILSTNKFLMTSSSKSLIYSIISQSQRERTASRVPIISPIWEKQCDIKISRAIVLI